MVKLGIATTKLLLLRSSKWVIQMKQAYRASTSQSTMSIVDVNHDGHQQKSLKSEEINGDKRESTLSWVPDGRTGIYVPKGHEWVMNDVPENAASFAQTHWFRTVDGVEKPDPDAPLDHQLSSHFY